MSDFPYDCNQQGISAKQILKRVVTCDTFGNIYFKTSGSYTFCLQYQAVYDAFPSKPDAAYAQQQDIMVRALVAAGIWAKLDVFYVFAQNARDSALVNWVNPGTFNAIEVNGLINFVQWQGYTGNGVNQYLRTQYNPQLHATNYLQNSASFGVYIRDNINENTIDIGYRGVSDSYLASRYTGSAYHTINDNTVNGALSLDSSGFWISAPRVCATWLSASGEGWTAIPCNLASALPSAQSSWLCFPS